MPKRIQLSRKRGWRMPENTVKVDRSSKWGNPFTIAAAREAGYKGTDADLRLFSVTTFRAWLARQYSPDCREEQRAYILAHIDQLRGLDLVCWCPLDQSCHADVLLQLANAPVETE